jgi:hypothetical protein
MPYKVLAPAKVMAVPGAPLEIGNTTASSPERAVPIARHCFEDQHASPTKVPVVVTSFAVPATPFVMLTTAP